MEVKYFRSRVGWWVYAIIPINLGCCMFGPILTGEAYVLGLLLSLPVTVLVILMLFGTKYAIRGKEFGVQCFYHWNWFPIEKVDKIAHVHSILASSALSTHRLAIKFSDPKILKSYAPIEISPADSEEFITDLKKINPAIKI